MSEPVSLWRNLYRALPTAEFDALVARAVQAERERDEAVLSTAYAEVQKARRQRDEARAEVERLRGVLRSIADGVWNVGTGDTLNVRDYARRALALRGEEAGGVG